MTAAGSGGPDRPVEPPLWHVAPPVLVLAALVLYGLMLRPVVFDQAPLPLEVLFPAAAAFAIAWQRLLGHRWTEIQDAVVVRMSRGVPGFFVLFAIGLLVGSWMVCGTIPMLVCWGIDWLEPRLLYALAFALPALFSTMTGTSFGSAATVGVVLMGVGSAVGADAAVMAGAVIGGAYFGDKLSPLSDTTNMAALGAGVDLFEHVRSMLWTTLPSAAIAITLYTVIGLGGDAVGEAALQTEQSRAVVDGLSSLFTFHPLLLLPPLIVLCGSVLRRPTIPVLGVGVLAAVVLALTVQGFDLQAVATSLTRGFDVALVPSTGELPEGVAAMVQRGGLYSMAEAIFAAFLVFFFVGVLDVTRAVPVLVGRAFAWARSRASLVLSALAASLATNALTSNQYATSFLVGDAFGSRFDLLCVPRRVLSRSIEDTGTMIEPLVPWHPSAIYMTATLGVAVGDYWCWQFLTLAHLLVAPLLAITGIGCGPRRGTAGVT